MAQQSTEHEGEGYLEALGIGYVANRMMLPPHQDKPARDFLGLCRQHAEPLLRGFVNMDDADPNKAVMRGALVGVISQYVDLDTPA